MEKYKKSKYVLNRSYKESTLEELLIKDRLIIIDGIYDPRNLGAVIRSAAILDYGVIIRKGKGCNSITETVINASSGGIDTIKFIFTGNILNIVKTLKDKEFLIISLDEKGEEIKLNYSKIINKICIVIGSETGVSKILLDNSHYILRLKSIGAISTYNASAAAAIAMYIWRNGE